MTQRLAAVIRGAVQGVGFRPFVYRLASELGLRGWVLNSPEGVFLEVEGEKQTLDAFLVRLRHDRPPRSFIQSCEVSLLDPVGYHEFVIRPSDQRGEKSTIVLPDIAVCDDCLRELFDPHDRRYRYPFINCTNCGPRFSIIEALPYDRPHTTMKHFTMCPECQREYDDPMDRRFHAQPNACPRCGPQLTLWDDHGVHLAIGSEALQKAIDFLADGRIGAIKGIGGFHLMTLAKNQESVQRLRSLKHREEKPFALMFPSLELLRRECDVSTLEEHLLTSPESPIVLLRRLPEVSHSAVAPATAPDNPWLGAMLPYAPLHHLLMSDLSMPVVATSGNLSDEPICTNDEEARQRLSGIAEFFLVHNRPITRHVDDSIVRIVAGRTMVVRRARGYAPLPVHIPLSPSPTLAVGAHLKNTVAISRGANVFISQHIGDLETAESYEAFKHEVRDLQNLYAVEPTRVVSDLHPDYLSSTFARSLALPQISIQHHYAHVAACMAENELEGRVLGVSWDGTGLGPDGTVWGGEFLLTNDTGYHRVAAFHRFRLPGGEKAVKEPRRTALGLLYEAFGDEACKMADLPPCREFTRTERQTLFAMIKQGANAPLTSSAGRLFDGVSALLGIRQRNSFEGQAAMHLEFLATDHGQYTPYTFGLQTHTEETGTGSSTDRGWIDWRPLLREIVDDIRTGIAPAHIASRLHVTLAQIIVAVAAACGEHRVVLTGGCFQNKVLTELAIQRLHQSGFRPYWHQRVPPNDGGIALGQVYAAARQRRG